MEIKIKRGTSTYLKETNPVLAPGEPCLETDTRMIKYGDGATPWNQLAYANSNVDMDGGELSAPAPNSDPGTFTPPSLEGLVLWLDGASRLEGYVSVVSSAVAQWLDKSSEKNNFFQSLKENRPVNSGTINGLGVVTFDGDDDAMLGSFKIPPQCTVFIVLRRNGPSTNGRVFTGTRADGSELSFCATEDGTSFGVLAGGEYLTAHDIEDHTAAVYSLVLSGNSVTTRINGLSTQSAEYSSDSRFKNFSVGSSRANYSSGAYSGDIAEIVVYDHVLTDTELQQVNSYLLGRWGIVQTNHPLLTGMKAFWPMNEESGTRLDIKSQVPLAETGTVGFVPGVMENGAELTGGGNYLEAPGTLGVSGSFSVSTWFKPDAVEGGSSQIVQNGSGAAAGQMKLGFGEAMSQDDLLLHFDGANGSTTFTDSSTNAHAVTANGNAVISTSQSKFGGASGNFDPMSQGYLQIDDAPGLDLSEGNFTIEAWFYARTLPVSVTSGLSTILSKDTYGSNFSWCISLAQDGVVVYTNNINGNWDFTSSATVSTNAWHHVAVCGTASSMQCFLDGELIGSVAFGLTNAASSITVGCMSWNSPANFFDGYIDELRIVKGTAVYTSNYFNPPTAPFGGTGSSLFGRIRTDSSTFEVSTTGVEADLWHHAAMVYSEETNTLTLYHNGEQADQVVVTGTFPAGSIPFRVGIGDQTSDQNDLAFSADQLGIWDRALTSDEIAMLYNDELGKEDFTADLYGDNVSLLLHMDKPANAVGGSGGGSGTLTNGLLAFWPLNETSGQRLDISGNARHLSDSAGASLAIGTGGATGFVAGKIGNAAEFTGDAGAKVLRLGTPLPAYETPTGSVAAWVKLNSLSEGRVIAGDYYRTPLSLWFEPNDGQFSGKLSGNQISISHPATSGAWYHLVFTYDHATKTGEFFVNGASVGTQTYSDPYTPVVNAGGFAVGSTGDGYPNHFIDGLVDAVGVWDRVLTETEVLELYNNGAGTETIAGNTDVYFNDVTLLLNLNGPDITDSSPKAHQITNNGATISTAQSKFGGASGYFDGVGDFIAINGESLASGFGTSEDFTIEGWFFPQDDPGGYVTAAGLFSPDGSQIGWLFQRDGSNVRFVSITTEVVVINGGTFVAGNWYHLAVTRSGGTTRFFQNGVLQGEPTNLGSYSVVPSEIRLGGNGFAEYFNGYIDDFRITKGVARYADDFDLPTAEFPLGSYTTITMPPVDTPLLLHFDGANESTTFTNSGSLNMEFTRNGSAEISTTQSQFGGSSLYLNGSTYGVYSYLTAPYSDKFEFGTGDFTVEGWIYWNSAKQGPLISIGEGFNGPGPWHVWALHPRADQNLVYWSRIEGPASMFYIEAPYTFSLNQWYHVAASRVNGVTRVFVNGVQIGSAVDGTNYSFVGGGNDNSLNIGRWYTGLGYQQHDGYIDEIRVIKGVGLYATNFTPPTAPFADPQPTPALLLHFDGFPFVDSGENELTVATNGPSLSTTESKFGGASGYFDGNNSRISVPASSDFAYGTGDFTIELWFYGLTLSGWQPIYAQVASGANYCVLGVENGLVTFIFNYNNPGVYVYGATVNSGAWHHVAVCRKNGVFTVYTDGIGGTPVTDSFNFDNTTYLPTIGGYSFDSPYNFNGYVDEVRVVKGKSVYTADFPLPTAPFATPFATPAPDLLLHFNGANGSTTFTDQGKNQLTVTVNAATISTAQSKFGGSSGYFNGVDSYISVADNDNLNFSSSDDFCIEGWIYFNDVTDGAPLISKGTDTSSGGWTVYVYQNKFYFGRPYIDNIINATTTLTANAWYHVAVTRENGTLRIFLNGAQEGNVSSSHPFSAPTFPVSFGKSHSNSYLNGYVDEVRVVKGHAIYTENFNLPAAPPQNPIITITQPGLANGLEAFWKFDDLTDSTGNGHDLVDINYTTITPGKIGGALTIDANSGLQYAKISNFRFLRAAGFSISGWVKSNNLSEITTPWVLSQGIPFGFCNGSMISFSSWEFVAGNAVCGGPSSTAINISNPAGIAVGKDGNWHHCVGTFDGSTGKFYFDGVLVGTQTGVTMDDTWPVPDAYFGSGLAEYARTGQTDSVAYWTRALTESEVLELYNNGNGTETLTGGGGGGAGQITTFIDSSKNNHTLTAFGNARLDLEDLKYGNASGAFDGDGDYLTVGDPEALHFGADDFTVECWIRSSDWSAGYQTIIGCNTTDCGSLFIPVGNDGKIRVGGQCNGWIIQADHTLQADTWHHIAVSRAAGVMRVFQDGEQIGSANDTTDFSLATAVSIGGMGPDSPSSLLNGNIDDLRITKGVARYVGEFNQPTKAFPDPIIVAPVDNTDPYAEDVVLLLHCDGANGSTTFTDNSYLQNIVTVDGNVVISTAQSKWGGASAYFDGSSCVSVTQTQQEFTFGTNDFTIEFWMRDNNSPTGVFNAVISNAQTTDNGIWFGRFDDSTVRLLIGADNVWDVTDSITGNVFDGEWHHVAIARAGNNVRVFVDGTAALETTTTVSIPNPENLFVIGSSPNYSQYFTGYIDDLRITKGVARYTAEFTLPDQSFPNPFTPVVQASLLLHFDGNLTDSSSNELVATVTGDAQISSAQSRFGGSSLYFPADTSTNSNNYIVVSNSNGELTLNTQFTIEFWYYPTTYQTGPGNGGLQVLFSGGEDHTYGVMMDGSGILYMWANTTGSGWDFQNMGINSPVPLNQWNHVAYVRDGGDFSLYLNGELANTGTAVNPSGSMPTTDFVIGRWGNGQSTLNDAYIDEVRITNGLAVYTYEFNPPTAPFAPGMFQPTDVNGSDLWLDASDSSTVHELGGSITTWDDKSGEGNDAGQYSTYATPSLVSSATPSGLPAVHFNGDPNALEVPYQFNLKNSSGFLVIRQSGTSSDYQISTASRVLAFQSATEQDWQTDDSFVITIDANIGGGSDDQITILSNYFANGYDASPVTCPIGWSVVGYTIDGQGTMRLRVNGEEVASAQNENMSSEAGGDLLIGFGGNFSSGNSLFGDIAAVVHYDHKLGAGAMAAVEKYLTEKYLNSNDPTALLLHFDGADGSTTFTDSSPNNLTVTPYGNAVISTTESRFGGASCYFDGEGDYLEVSDPPGFNFGADDFTVEGWFYTPNSSAVNSLFSQRASGENDLSFDFLVYQGFTYMVLSTNGTSWATQGGGSVSVPDNQWVHVAYVRSGSSFYAFVNGTLSQTLTLSGPLYPSAEPFRVGGNTVTGQYSIGYIDEVRVLKGVALYTSNFTPPDMPFGSSTALLMHFDGLDGSTIFTDSSPNNLTVTPSGNAVISTAQSKFGGASGYFDGNSYLSIPDSPQLRLDEADFTMEAFVRFPSELNGYMGLFQKGIANVLIDQTNGAYDIAFWNHNGVPTLRVVLVSVSCCGEGWWDKLYPLPNGTVNPGSWNHVAICRSGGTVYSFWNGVLIGSDSIGSSTVIWPASSCPTLIGARNLNSLSGFDGYFNGYTDEVRVVKGAALYTSNFTPPTEPFGVQTSLLLHFDGNFNDSGAGEVSLTNNGVAIDTVTTKFGSGSGYFDGSSVTTLTAPDSPAFGFGTGDFTIEMFVKQQSGVRNSVLSVGTYQNGILWRLTPSVPDSLYLAVNAPGGGSWDWDATTSVPFDAWTHIALTRQSGTLRAFIDGLKVFEQAGVTVDLGASRPLTIGCGAHELQPIDAYNGYIDELRIMKGLAIYTDSFTPPAAPF